MGRFVTSVLFLLALVLLSGCSSLPVPEPLSGSSSGIGIAVKNRAPIRLFGNRDGDPIHVWTGLRVL